MRSTLDDGEVQEFARRVICDAAAIQSFEGGMLVGLDLPQGSLKVNLDCYPYELYEYGSW